MPSDESQSGEPMHTKERLTFRYDLQDPEAVYHFIEQFSVFLVRQSSPEDGEAFLDLVRKYFRAIGEEDYNFATVINIAAQFADLEDISGTPFEDNPYLSVPGAQTAEDVLEELDAERDTPVESIPAFPEVCLEVQPRDDLAMIVYRAIRSLRDQGYKAAGSCLAQDARHLLRTRPTKLELLRLVESYVLVDYTLALDPVNERRIRR